MSSSLKPIRSRSFLGDLFVVWVLATASLCLGLAINQLRDNPLSLVYQTREERMKAVAGRIAVKHLEETLATTDLPKDLSLEELQSFVREKKGIVLDARPEIFYRSGHVPGALSLPRDDFESYYEKLKGILEKNKNRPFVIYCANTFCEDSLLLQKSLASLGFSKVYLFRGGWKEWRDAKLVVETSP